MLAWLHRTNNAETNDKTAAVLFALGMSGACSLAVVLFAMTSLAGLFTGIKSDTTAGELLSTALLGLAVTPVLKVGAAARTYFVFARIATSTYNSLVSSTGHRAPARGRAAERQKECVGQRVWDGRLGRPGTYNRAVTGFLDTDASHGNARTLTCAWT